MVLMKTNKHRLKQIQVLSVWFWAPCGKILKGLKHFDTPPKPKQPQTLNLDQQG